VADILGRIVAQQRADDICAAGNADGGENDEGEFHLAPPPEEPCSPRMTDAIDFLDKDAGQSGGAIRDEAELGRRLGRLLDAPLVCRGDQTRIVHSAHFPQSRAMAPKANAAMRANTAIMLRARG
jgi:hypothetical protein